MSFALIFVTVMLVACRGNDDKPRVAEPPSGTKAEPESPVKSGDPVVAVRERPSLPPAGSGTAPSNPRQDGVKSAAETAFAAETRDDDWAPDTEKELQKRFAKVRGAKLEDAECRQSSCRIVLAGSSSEVSRAISDLEGSRGLHGYAKNIVLTAPEKKSDGSLVMRAFATFER